MRRRRAVAITASIVAALSPQIAGAYDYNEHAYVSHHALAALAALDVEMMADLRGVVSTSVHEDAICEEARFDRESQANCLVAADIPALAGDHSPSPVFLLWRWFDSDIESVEGLPLLEILKTPFAVMGEDDTPEETDVEKPDYRGLIRIRARHDSSHWGVGAERMSNFELLGVDRAYVRLAARGHSHFRQRMTIATGPRLALRRKYEYAGRARHKPQQEAYAWYGDLHLGALVFAREAARVADQRSDEAALLRGLAWFLELNAWHYLQDGAAAGHIVGDLDRLEATTLNATHDHFSERGVLVARNEKLETFAKIWREGGNHEGHFDRPLTPPRTSAWIMGGLEDIASERPLRVFGDGKLSQQPELARASIAYASAVSLISGLEVLDALEGRWTDDQIAPDRTVATCRERAVPDELLHRVLGDAELFRNEGRIAADAPRRVPVYSCLHAWWETPTAAEERSEAIIKAWNAGAFEASELLPEPVELSEDLPQTEYFSGGGLGLAVGGDAAWNRAFVPSLTIHAFTGAPRYTVNGVVQAGVYVRLIPPESESDHFTRWGRRANQMSLGGGVELRPFWGFLPVMSKASVGAQCWSGPRCVLDVGVVPAAYLFVDDRTATIGLGPKLGFNEDFGTSLGLVLDVGYWPNR